VLLEPSWLLATPAATTCTRPPCQCQRGCRPTCPLRSSRYASWVKPGSLGHGIKFGKEDFDSLEAWALQQQEDPAALLPSAQQELAELMLSWYV
jgi:hypothetical protein